MYSELVDVISRENQVRESSNITSIVVINTQGLTPDTINSAKFVVKMNTGKVYYYTAEASPFIFKTFLQQIEKNKLGTAINTIEPYITNYKDSLDRNKVEEGLGKTLATTAVAGAMLLGQPNIAQAKPAQHITQQEEKIDFNKLLFAIKQVESSGGVDKKNRYEANTETSLKNRFKIISQVLRDAIKQYGFKALSTSYGPYQIIAATAYDMGYRGNPLDLQNEVISKPFVEKYLKYLMQSKKTNNLDDVLSAYNAGLGGVGSNPEYVAKVKKHYKITEKIGNFEYSSIQIRIPKEVTEKIAQYVLQIPEEDLYTKEEGYGREIDSHITIKYGLTTIDAKEIKEKLKEYQNKQIEIELGLISSFEKDDKSYDVLKIDVLGKDVLKLNKIMSGLDNEDENPKYIPHLTLAYLKKNKIDKYLDSDIFKGIKFKVNNIEFSGKDNVLSRMELNESAEEDIQNLINVQVNDPIVKKDTREGEYFRGLANGMIVAKACVDKKEPKFVNPNGELDESEQPTIEEQEEFFKIRTNKHINLVKQSAKKIVDKYPEYKEVLVNVEKHDSSKFEEPEHTPYLILTWNKFKGIKDTNPYTNKATLHHILNNPHHPEYHAKEANLDPNDRDKSTKVIDASKMDDISIVEMVADWQGMSIELGTNTARDWFNKVRNTRWHFSTQQEELIDKLLKVFE